MINQRIANGFGYLSLGVLLLLFLLDWAGVLPPNLKMPLFFLALALFLATAVLFGLKKTRSGAALAYLGLLITLLGVNILSFYFEQFSAILSVNEGSAASSTADL